MHPGTLRRPNLFAVVARIACLTFLTLPAFFAALDARAEDAPPLGPVGRVLLYRHASADPLRPTVVREWSLALGSIERVQDRPAQWLHFRATKADATTFEVALLAHAYPAVRRAETPAILARYLLREGNGPWREFRDRFTDQPVLPGVADWRHLLPRDRDEPGAGFSLAEPPETARLLGHAYRRAESRPEEPPRPPTPDRIFRLLPQVLVGLPSNRKQVDETRRYDGSDYAYTPLTRADYAEMIEAGFNCVRIDAGQLPWVEDLDTFYWGIGAGDLPFPECLYRSTYLGPALFLDEPAVGTRDHVLRPRLAKEPGFRRAITPQIAFEAFREHFAEVLEKGAPAQFRNALAARPDVDLGSLPLRQANLYSWETMPATAGYQLSRDPDVPIAMVFEPPGRIGTRRTVPEFNLSYGCQLAVEDPRHLTDVIYGFLRGAARATGKTWGTSVYGAVQPADAPGFLLRAYDLGATHFFFWDNYQLACVPFHESLRLARLLRSHAEANPRRDLDRLRTAAEVAIVLPPGYNLGHVHLGRGSLWGLPELNLERTNSAGVSHRAVMSAAFTEIERCFRLGVAFDLHWQLPEIKPLGYREIVRIRENGQVELTAAGRVTLLPEARRPERPEGAPPEIRVHLSERHPRARTSVLLSAVVQETAAPVYYTTGADPRGVYHNAVVDWELFGPAEEDYRHLAPAQHQPKVESHGNRHVVETELRFDRPGNYRLRAAVGDLAGRTTVVWTPIEVTE